MVWDCFAISGLAQKEYRMDHTPEPACDRLFQGVGKDATINCQTSDPGEEIWSSPDSGSCSRGTASWSKRWTDGLRFGQH